MKVPALKPKQVKAVRWLSYKQACDTMRHILPCVVMSLHSEASDERNDSQALRFIKQVECWRFVACLHMLCDILPALATLSPNFQVNMLLIHYSCFCKDSFFLFQKSSLDFSGVAVQLKVVEDVIDAHLTTLTIGQLPEWALVSIVC